MCVFVYNPCTAATKTTESGAANALCFKKTDSNNATTDAAWTAGCVASEATKFLCDATLELSNKDDAAIGKF